MDDDLYRLLVRIGLSDLASRAVVHVSEILVIAVVAMVATRLVTRAARRSVRTLVSRAPLGDATRLQRRAETLGGVTASAIRITVWTVAALVIIDKLGLNVGPLIAGAGVIGIALAFGAQSLVKDVVAGFFILAEDQLGVGDVVVLEGVNGVVEEVNLRLTRLRSDDGVVWFIPNGQITKVGNSSKSKRGPGVSAG